MKPGRTERKNRGLSSQNRKKCGRKEADRKGKGRRRKRKASTRGTAVGAKRGRTKGNKQEAEYENLEGRHERLGWRERGNRGSESGDGNCGSHCEAEAGMAERKKQRLSSRKRNRSGRKKAEGKRKMPKAKAEGKHLRNSCGKRIREGRKETNRKLSTGTGKESMRNQAGENGEDRRSESESGALRKPL